MKIDKKYFFEVYKQKFGSLKQSQVEHLDSIITAFENEPRMTNIKWLAYILATAAHETNHTYAPVIEGYWLPESKRINTLYNYYVKNNPGALKTIFPNGVNKPYYVGRGLVQLTHNFNYKKLGDILNVDLLKNPDLAMDQTIAARVCFIGMVDGLFTGFKLSDFITSSKANYKSARKIINGLDKASLIAGYAVDFESALRIAAPSEQADAVNPDPTLVSPGSEPATPID